MNPKALLVEDNQSDAQLITRRLKAFQHVKFAVECAETLSAASTLLANRSYDVIFLDLGLPDSAGVDTVLAIRRSAPLCPVLVLSGREDFDTALNSLRAGAQSFVVKTPDLSADLLGREALYAMERVAQAAVLKRLLLQSMAVVSDAGPAGQLVGKSLTALEEAIERGLDFVRKNHPGALEGLETLVSGYPTLLADIRASLALETPEGKSAVSRAVEVLQSIKGRDTLPGEDLLTALFGGTTCSKN